MTDTTSALRRVGLGVHRRGDSERSERAATTAALRRLGAGCCYICGSHVEEGLARLGSTLCHDCRDGRAQAAHAGF